MNVPYKKIIEATVGFADLDIICRMWYTLINVKSGIMFLSGWGREHDQNGDL